MTIFCNKSTNISAITLIFLSCFILQNHYIFHNEAFAQDKNAKNKTQDKKEKIILIGTGAGGGIYSPVATAICQLVNRYRLDYGLGCSSRLSKGSIDNLLGLHFSADGSNGTKYHMGIAQSDTLYQAYNREYTFRNRNDKDFSKLRVIFWLHEEMATILVRDNINELSELNGKKFNVGPPGSGTRFTWRWLEDKLKHKEIFTGEQNFAEFTNRKALRELCKEDSDLIGYFSIIGHPSARIHHPLNRCKAKILPINGISFGSESENYPLYTPAELPETTYPKLSKNTTTFSVRSALVTTSEIESQLIYNIVEIISENIDHFKKMHPILSGLTIKEMIPYYETSDEYHDGYIAELDGYPPIHKGARVYFEKYLRLPSRKE